MADWLSSMQQTYEFYKVDPTTWFDYELIESIISCTITYDESDSTLGSASIDTTEEIEECYIRIYLVIIQNGSKEKFSLGTFLVQTPSVDFDGKTSSITMDAYTPLIELKEKLLPIGYYVAQEMNIMSTVTNLTKNNLRAPVVAASSSDTVASDFVAASDDTWLSFLTDLMANAKYSFQLDDKSRILFAPEQDTASLQPVWTYTDDNSSILYPDITTDRDLYGVPNVVEVLYSTNSDNNAYLYARVVNDDENSSISTVNRGREIVYRDTDPSLTGDPTQTQIDQYAEQLLRTLSSLEYTVTYTHGYCPVRVGDCVFLNYTKAGLSYVKARVTSQSITCESGCSVEETATFTKKLWG